ncbi:hypothetical protein DPMN_039240 [Dreissena polymorpha]|uniref:Uncharacterized protein n=1 Tax=Dreissena polymorpha TaxID=45954 RepID=A0A9D4MGU6_DREPO|nr:hypothetical protein DPMN_039240 [Dreissena polymorpha]
MIKRIRGWTFSRRHFILTIHHLQWRTEINMRYIIQSIPFILQPCSTREHLAAFSSGGKDTTAPGRHTIDGPHIRTESTLTGQDRSTGNQTNTTLSKTSQLNSLS